MKIKPSNYPQLKLILWNRNDEDLIDEEEAFALYERNWHHIDQASLTPHEKTLIDDLTKRLGAGVMNV